MVDLDFRRWGPRLPTDPPEWFNGHTIALETWHGLVGSHPELRLIDQSMVEVYCMMIETLAKLERERARLAAAGSTAEELAEWDTEIVNYRQALASYRSELCPQSGQDLAGNE